jgi:hypothetical protein
MARGSLQLEAKATVKLGSFLGVHIAGSGIEPPQTTRTLPRLAAAGLCGDAQSFFWERTGHSAMRFRSRSRIINV